MVTAFFEGHPGRYRPGPEARIDDPPHVARAVVFALTRPPGCEVREMFVRPSVEPSRP